MVSLDTARRAHEVRQAVDADAHLRWVAGEVYWIAHRRAPEIVPPAAVCGAPGDLILAPPGVPACAACWSEASGQ